MVPRGKFLIQAIVVVRPFFSDIVVLKGEVIVVKISQTIFLCALFFFFCFEDAFRKKERKKGHSVNEIEGEKFRSFFAFSLLK